MVLKPGKEPMAEAIFRKWELDFAVIGEVTDTGHMVLTFDGEVVCDIPLGPLADDAPEYDRPYVSREEYKAWAQVKPLPPVPDDTDVAANLLKLMASPDLASRRWIWEQYDSQVMADTLQKPGGDAAVVRVHGTSKALAISTDCTPRYCYADPYEGGKQAIAECYRNLSAVGATPLAVTNCLNFANPQRPEIMAQFVGCLEGMGEACRALDFPIVSGNVSLYNESKAMGGGSAILPTPAIGGVGLLGDYARMATIALRRAGLDLVLIGPHGCHLGQSRWMLEGFEAGDAPPVDLALERKNGEFVRALIADGLVDTVHDLSDGGLAVALAEIALAGGKGMRLSLPDSGIARPGWYFGEDQARYVVATANLNALIAAAEANEVECTAIGQSQDRSVITFDDGSEVSLADLREAHESFFRDWMEG